MPDTVQILRGLKERYASHHGVQVRAWAVMCMVGDVHLCAWWWKGVLPPWSPLMDAALSVAIFFPSLPSLTSKHDTFLPSN